MDIQDIQDNLISAAIDGNLEAVQLFWIQANTVSDELLDKEVLGEILLESATDYGHLTIVQFCVQQGIAISSDAVRWSARGGYLDVLKYIEQCGADLYFNEETPLSLATEGGHFEMVEYLVSKGADVNADHGKILMISVLYHWTNIADYLITQGADVGLAWERARQNFLEDRVPYLKTKFEQEVLNAAVDVQEIKHRSRL